MLKAKLKPAIREHKFFSLPIYFGQTLVPVVEVSLALGLGLEVSKVSKVLCKKFLDTNVASGFKYRTQGNAYGEGQVRLEGSSGEAAGFSKVIRSVRKVVW